MMLIPGANVELFAFPIAHAMWGIEGITYFRIFKFPIQFRATFWFSIILLPSFQSIKCFDIHS